MSKSAGLLRRLVPKQPCAAAYAGQPTHATHPEARSLHLRGLNRVTQTCLTSSCRAQLLAEGEVWPGVTGAELAARRQRLAGLMPVGGVAVLPAAQRVCMTGAIPYPLPAGARMCPSCLAAPGHAPPGAARPRAPAG